MDVFEHIGADVLVRVDSWGRVVVRSVVGAREGKNKIAERIGDSSEIAALVAVAVLLDGRVARGQQRTDQIDRLRRLEWPRCSSEVYLDQPAFVRPVAADITEFSWLRALGGRFCNAADRTDTAMGVREHDIARPDQ